MEVFYISDHGPVPLAQTHPTSPGDMSPELSPDTRGLGRMWPGGQGAQHMGQAD